MYVRGTDATSAGRRTWGQANVAPPLLASQAGKAVGFWLSRIAHVYTHVTYTCRRSINRPGESSSSSEITM